MPSHFPIFIKSNNKNMGFKDMADVDFYVGFGKHNSNYMGNIKIFKEIENKTSRVFKLYFNDKLIETKHVER